MNPQPFCRSRSLSSRYLTALEFPQSWRPNVVRPPRRSDQLFTLQIGLLGFVYSRRPPYKAGGFEAIIFAFFGITLFVIKNFLASKTQSKNPPAGRGGDHARRCVLWSRMPHVRQKSLTSTPCNPWSLRRGVVQHANAKLNTCTFSTSLEFHVSRKPS